MGSGSTDPRAGAADQRRAAARRPSTRRADAAANRWDVGAARGRFELEPPGLLIVTATGILTVSALECLRDLVLARYRCNELGAILMDVRSCVLAITADGLDRVQQCMPRSALRISVAWCAIPDVAVMLDEHADNSVRLGALRAVFESPGDALAWARREASARMAQRAYDARGAQHG